MSQSRFPMTHSKLVRRTAAGVFAAAALSFSTHSAAAQKAQAGDRDAQTLANYRLTEPTLRKYFGAMENVAKAVAKDTTLAASIEASTPDGDEDIATMATRLDHVPVFKRALAASGLTSTEFTTFSMSYMQAEMAYGLMTQGPEKTRLKELPKGTPKANVDFVGSHQALIQQLTDQLKSIQPPGSN